MRKSNTQKISEVLKDYVESMNIGGKLKEVDIIHAWEEVLGSAIGRYTSEIYIAKGILYVRIKSPVVKSELMMMREEIRSQLNLIAGREIIKSITFR